jgi:hypothetical protein
VLLQPWSCCSPEMHGALTRPTIQGVGVVMLLLGRKAVLDWRWAPHSCSGHRPPNQLAACKLSLPHICCHLCLPHPQLCTRQMCLVTAGALQGKCHFS